MTTQPEQPQPMTRDEFRRFVDEAMYAVVATVNEDGQPEAALVEILAAEDGRLVFQSKAVSRKVANLRRSDRIALVIGTTGAVSLQIEGTAEPLTAEETAEWGPRYTARFPHRPPVGEMFGLFQVRPDWLRRHEQQSGQPPVVTEGLPR